MTSSAPRRVHLVVDTGVDDALAIVVAWRHPGLELTGVTAAAGNVSLAQSLTNTRFVLDVVGATPVPLSAGAARRHDGVDFAPRPVHGPDGLAGLSPPTTDVEPSVRGVPVIDDRTTLVCLAPMTTLLAMVPCSVVATFAQPGQANHAMDPVAADTVRSGWSVRDAQPGALPRVDWHDAAWPLGGRHDRVVDLVRRLVAHQRRRGVGLGDAEALLGLVGSRDPLADLVRLMEP